MKEKSLQVLKEMNKQQLIDRLLLKTIKGGCCSIEDEPDPIILGAGG